MKSGTHGDRPGGLAEYARAAALFAALTVVFTYPLSFSPASTAFANDPDVHLLTWILSWVAHALVHQPLALFDANILFPYPRTLAFSENLIGSVIFSGPVLWLTGNPVLALNVVSLLSCALSGVGAYVLARRLGLGAAAATVCGLIFAFSPARLFRFGQTHVATVQWIPFMLAYLHGYLSTGKRADLGAAMAFFALQALCTGHGAVFAIVAAGCLVVARLMAGEPLALARRLRDVGLVGWLLLAPIVAAMLPYLAVQREMGLRRTLENWAVSGVSFLASPTNVHTWLLARFTDGTINQRANAFLFPGYLPIALAVIAVAALRGRPFRRHTLTFLALTVLAALLSAGPPLGLWPLVYWWPGFNFIRVPSRFFVLAVLGIAVLAAIGVEQGLTRMKTRTRFWAPWAVGGLLAAEFLVAPFPSVPFPLTASNADRWLDTQPKPFAIAEVPVGPFVRYHSTYMLHSMVHWQKTVHGHSGIVTPLHERLYDQLRSFPDRASLDALAEIGVTYVVVHIADYEPGQWEAAAPRFEQFGDRLALRYEDPTGRVYALQPAVAVRRLP